MPRLADAIDLLHQDHERVQELLRRAQQADDAEFRKIAPQVCRMLTQHSMLEEQAFYPYVRLATGMQQMIEEALLEHGSAFPLIAELEQAEPDAHGRALMEVLAEYTNHHIREEEQQIFPALEKTGVDLEALGQELAEQRKAIEAGKPMPERNWAGSPAPEPRRDEQKPGTSERGHAEREQQPRDTTKADRAYMKAHGDELAASVKRAKWIHSVDEHEDHAGQTLVTRNHAVIRQWAEARGGKPATVGSPKEGERPRVLRFDFPDYDKGLQHIDWDAWLRVFDERNLVFLFQEHQKAGNQSNFFILNSPEREDG